VTILPAITRRTVNPGFFKGGDLVLVQYRCRGVGAQPPPTERF